MDPILLSKTLLIGCLGAGGFYFIMSFAFQYFPLPLYLKSRSIALAWASSKHKKENDIWHRIWQLIRRFFVFVMLLTWWGIFAMYAYCYYNMLQYYTGDLGQQFWIYYGIGISIPALLVLIQFFRFFRPKIEEKVTIEDWSDKTLIERMSS